MLVYGHSWIELTLAGSALQDESTFGPSPPAVEREMPWPKNHLRLRGQSAQQRTHRHLTVDSTAS
jgi:hypothetical protein